MADRRAMPSELRRRILVEAGHRCAITTCRHIEVEVHHIVPWETSQAHEYENLIALCPNCHRRADRGEIDRKSLRIYKSSLRFTHDRFSQFEVDVLIEAYRNPPGSALQFPPFNALLIKRLIEAGFVHLSQSSSGVYINGMQTSPDYLRITTKGKDYVDALGIHDFDEDGGA